jgi:replication factor A1
MMVPTSRQLWYPACPNPECKNKKVEGSEGEWVCRHCNKQISAPKERYAFAFSVADYTGSGFVSALGDDAIGQAVTGFTAATWAAETRGVDEQGMRKLLADAYFGDLKVKVRVKTDDYQGESRQKMTALQVVPVNYGEAARFYAEEIKKYSS